ncbi:zinc-finger-containing protein [Coleofasciculus sp. G2-EDA-02]|uniref:zinc-finger-containing protein n=1 Tax=Coleofasciculus sp. G2-EDA-02 TaxID=3069529 RepID=UPI00330476CB
MDKRLILSGKICPYCGRETEFTDSAKVYHGKNYGMIYLCRPCQAWVGVHSGTDKALGRLANAELRRWKQNAHACFDPLWKRKMQKGFSKAEARNAGYKWLSQQMNLPPQETHIAMFDIEQCKKVVELCRPYSER